MPRHSRAVTSACLFVPACLLSAPAAAEPEPQERGPIIIVGEREVDLPHETPGGADRVLVEEFEDSIAVSLRDALAFSPGVYAQPRFGQEVRLSIRGSGISRGFHMRGLLLLQDGIPINLADNNGDFQELDPAVFRSIEVYRGGNALRFGGSTLGGAINANTPTGRTAPGYEVRIDGGSYETLRTKAAAGSQTARGDAYVALTTDRSNGDRNHAYRDALRFNGNVGLRLSDMVETRFYASVNRIDQDLPGALTREQALETPRLSLPGNIAGNQARDINSLRLQNRTTVALGQGTLAFGAFLNAKQLYHPIFQVVDQDSLDTGVFARGEWGGTLRMMPVELALGSIARFGTAHARQYVNVGGGRGALTADVRQKASTVDSYIEVRATPLPPFTLIAGGVYTHGERTVTNHLAPLRSGSASFDTFAPKFGLLVKPAEAVQFYANASRSVELPGFSELNQTPFAVGGVVTPGFVGVDAQRAWTFEVGTRGSRAGVSWDLTYYRANIRGELLQFDQAPDVPAATFNADRTLHQGVEAGLDIAVLPWLQLRQVYQWNDFRFRDDARYGDNRLPVVPEFLYRGELRLGTDALSLSPRLEWVPRGGFADYRNTTRTTGYVLLGLGAEANVAERFTLFMDVRNLGDRAAIGDLSATVIATPASAIYYPVERRAVYGGVRARL